MGRLPHWIEITMQDTLSAFQTAAGISPDKMSLFIRTILLALVFVWAAWCIYGQVNYFKHHGVEIEPMMHAILRISIILSLAIGLVFI
jgi:integrating conjugative element protein (TIGR03758 family)